MNSHLSQLQPYPFQRLRDLFAGIQPNADYQAVNLSIGEPKHDTPTLIKEALVNNLSGLASYPTTAGILELRKAISNWANRPYDIHLNAETEVIPVNGSREALFAFTQAIIDGKMPADKLGVTALDDRTLLGMTRIDLPLLRHMVFPFLLERE